MNTKSFLVCFIVVMLATSIAMAGTQHGNFAPVEAVSFATEPADSTAVIGTAAIGMVATGAAIGIATTITLMISFSLVALAFPSSAIRMAMDITLMAMAILPTATDMG